MANYYTETCIELRLPLPAAHALIDGLSAVDYLRNGDHYNLPEAEAIAILTDARYSEAAIEFAVQFLGNDYDSGNGFDAHGVQIDQEYPRTATVILTDSEGGPNLTGLIEGLCALQSRYKFAPIRFSWARRCDSHRVDAFAGGAAFIANGESREVDTYAWLHQQTEPLRPWHVRFGAAIKRVFRNTHPNA